MITYEDIKDSPTSSEEKKPRRKSMLLCGRRRSKSLGGSSVAGDFCQSIPLHQSKEERLKQLLKMSFQHTLLSVCREFRNSDDFDMTTGIDTLLEHYDVIESIFEKDNLIEHVMSKPPQVEQSENIAIEKYIEGINVLEKESEEWDNIFEEEESKLSKAVKLPEELLLQGTNEVDYLTEAVSHNYEELLNETNTALSHFAILANHISNSNDIPSSVLNTNNKSLKDISLLATKYLAKDLHDTPRTLLKNLKIVSGS